MNPHLQCFHFQGNFLFERHFADHKKEKGNGIFEEKSKKFSDLDRIFNAVIFNVRYRGVRIFEGASNFLALLYWVTKMFLLFHDGV